MTMSQLQLLFRFPFDPLDTHPHHHWLTERLEEEIRHVEGCRTSGSTEELPLGTQDDEVKRHGRLKGKPHTPGLAAGRQKVQGSGSAPPSASSSDVDWGSLKALDAIPRPKTLVLFDDNIRPDRLPRPLQIRIPLGGEEVGLGEVAGADQPL